MKNWLVKDLSVRVAPQHAPQDSVECQSGAGSLGEPARNVHVIWHSEKYPPPATAAARIEERWRLYLAEAQAHGRTLFNGPVSRLISCARAATHVELHLAASDYKTFVVTRLCDRAWFESHAPEAMAQALGNSVLVTRGDEAFLGIRSANVSVYPGRAHLIGGILDLLGTPEFPGDTTGMIAHLRLELREEIGVDDADLTGHADQPRFFGIVEDQILGQPEALWQWELRTPFEEMATRMDRREHSAWLKIRRGIMNDGDWKAMTPAARYAWRIWSKL